MRIDLSHLMSQIGVEEVYPQLHLRVPGDPQIKEFTDVTLAARSIGEAIQFLADYTVHAVLRCSRCLSEFDVVEPGHLEEYLVLEHGSEGPHGEVEWVATEEDRDIVHGKTLDLTELLRQNALVQMPMRPLCRVECLGLCPVCGDNLNDGLCRCSQAVAPKDTALRRAFLRAGLRDLEK